ncbi:hypothetical protein [Rhodoferax sp. PAMC 29310]|uniref:hypothetical protein n=1 Tax=Rhodoferax sp. PAMC 29310 TaxID=2822760 RepID=UPI001B324451|nr:hypothetical protein [Rhodoferax sp. PAMC 29310]
MNQPIDILKGSKAGRTARTVVTTLFLGALGSGLWEFFLKDAFLAVGNMTLTLISSLWGGYVDYLYRDIGKLHTDLLQVPLFSLIEIIFIAGPLYLTFTLWRDVGTLEKNQSGAKPTAVESLETISQGIGRIRRKILRQLLPFTLSASFIFLLTTWQILYTRETSNWSERAIEIISPYISMDDRVRLRSDLRSITNEKSFLLLRTKLLGHAKRAAVDLPKFTPIGIQGGV